MTTVYIWNFTGKKESWGHAALQVQSYYMSWWPKEPGQVPSGWHENVYASMPILGQTYEDDCSGMETKAGHQVIINGLNEKAMISWWRVFGITDGMQGAPEAWQSLQLNCSTVVAKALSIGGGRRYAPFLRSRNIVWTPQDVLQYAQSIRTNITKGNS